ncbi:MAG TPA: hypothetical protein VD969_13245 [Symbiobacteriaceae bacterium]|nr:hypothetical protein [Symbiobacteriaceae bacterium]
MKRLMVALAVAALLGIFAVPALASQNRPVDPSAVGSGMTRAFSK